MKSLGKTVGKIAVAGAAIGAYSYLSALGFNHLFNNKEKVDGAYHSVSKPDGAWRFTRYSQERSRLSKRDEVNQVWFWLEYRKLIDGTPWGENDGLVDKIVDSDWTDLNRDRDYNANKEEFDKADKLLAETKERFKEYFPTKEE